MSKYRIETEDGHTYEVETEDPAPSYPSPTLPKQLQGPPPSGLEQAMQNIPGSPMHSIQNPYGPGVPQGNPTFEGDYHGPTPESVGSELSNLVPHPIEDPVGTALQIATLGKFRKPIIGAGKGAVRGATEMVPLRRHGVGLDVPAPIAGASLGGFAGWASHVPHGSEIGAAIGAAAPIVKGAVGGIKEALADPNARFLEDAHRTVVPLGEETPAVRSPVAPVVSSEQAVMPPSFRNRPGVNNEPVFQSPQAAAAENTHLSTVTQADEFRPPNVAPPNPVVPPTQVPISNPQPIPPVGQAPKPPMNPATVSGGETPSGPEVIKPNTAPPGEDLIPKTEQVFQEMDKNRDKLRTLLEEYKRKHPTKKP